MKLSHHRISALLIALLAGGCASVNLETQRTAGAVALEQGADRDALGMRIALTSVFVDNPVKAHAFYTEVLGFESKVFDPSAQLAIVVSADDPNGTALLLEPLGFAFAREYQEKVFNAGFPIIIFEASDLPRTIERLEANGVKFRDDLTRKEWGLENMFEDSFGNLIMLQEIE